MSNNFKRISTPRKRGINQLEILHHGLGQLVSLFCKMWEGISSSIVGFSNRYLMIAINFVFKLKKMVGAIGSMCLNLGTLIDESG